MTKNKEFATVNPPDTRLRLLESFINRMLEINQGKAAQNSAPLRFKEVNDWAKEFVENRDQYVKADRVGQETTMDTLKSLLSQTVQKKDRSAIVKDREKFNIDYMRKNLVGKKVKGKEICIGYNTKEGCKHGNGCTRGHFCAYIPRGEKDPCGKEHSKLEHWKKV